MLEISKCCENLDESHLTIVLATTFPRSVDYNSDSRTRTFAQETRFFEPHDTIMPPKKKAPRVWTASAVKAEDITPHTCAEFRLKWTPTQFCRLSSSERKAILLGLLTSSDSISIVQVHGGYNFATEHTPIHGAVSRIF